MALIEEAVGSGCRREVACLTLELSLRTYQRWTQEGGNAKTGGRKGSHHKAPPNKLSEDERQQILLVANSAEFASSPPSQIVPTLVNRGEYLASESTIYRLLKAQEQQRPRGPSIRVVISDYATEADRL
ncbi:helix-turn-helix domain-containing protein [Glaciimonas sp. PAMC28666]|nr:helix-turn-helix domain-containing protein [Glaciimonas sp. PAMC28666]